MSTVTKSSWMKLDSVAVPTACHLKHLPSCCHLQLAACEYDGCSAFLINSSTCETTSLVFLCRFFNELLSCVSKWQKMWREGLLFLHMCAHMLTGTFLYLLFQKTVCNEIKRSLLVALSRTHLVLFHTFFLLPVHLLLDKALLCSSPVPFNLTLTSPLQPSAHHEESRLWKRACFGVVVEPELFSQRGAKKQSALLTKK